MAEDQPTEQPDHTPVPSEADNMHRFTEHVNERKRRKNLWGQYVDEQTRRKNGKTESPGSPLRFGICDTQEQKVEDVPEIEELDVSGADKTDKKDTEEEGVGLGKESQIEDTPQVKETQTEHTLQTKQPSANNTTDPTTITVNEEKPTQAEEEIHDAAFVKTACVGSLPNEHNIADIYNPQRH